MRVTIGVLGVLTVGFGCSGSGTTAPAICGPLQSGGQLDPQAAGDLVVAPDEKHVAFLRDPVTVESGCPSRATQWRTGTLVVASLQPDGSSCERVVARDVLLYSIFFSPDSRSLVFREGIDMCGVGDLKAAEADGANVRLVRRSVYSSVARGASVIFDLLDTTDFAAPIAGGATVSLGTHNETYPDNPSFNAPGTAFARLTDGSEGYGVAASSLVLVELPSGERRTIVDSATERFGNNGWSHRGDWLALPHAPAGASTDTMSLTLVAADDSERIEISTNCRCQAVAFTPDDSWLAYDEPDSSGGTRIVTRSLKDGSKVTLGVLPAGYAQLLFSGDGANVVAMVSTPQSVKVSVYGATTGVSGSLQLLTTDVYIAGDTIAGGGHVVLPLSTGMLQVFPVAGGAPVALAGVNPQFETGVPAPHLLFSQYSPTLVGVAAADGTAVTSRALPDSIAFATWLGSAAVYGFGPYDQITISALTNGGTVTTELARTAGAYAWAPIAAPTRLFYSRAASSADGPPGVWLVDLPR